MIRILKAVETEGWIRRLNVCNEKIYLKERGRSKTEEKEGTDCFKGVSIRDEAENERMTEVDNRQLRSDGEKLPESGRECPRWKGNKEGGLLQVLK